MKTKLTLCFLVLGIMLVSIASVSATHTSSVIASPIGWLKNNQVTEFNFSITNNGPDAISTVIITRPGDGFSNIASCGDVTEWVKTKDDTYCKWQATASQKINAGSSKTFSLILTTGTYGLYNWSVETRDSISSQENFVPIEIQTIQHAINNATVGDTINVPAGTYTESLTINKTLILQGAGRDVTTITGANTITANNVVVDGFKLNGGITINDAANPISGGTISNNIITGSSDGIRVGYGTGHGVDHITIRNNKITGNTNKGILFYNAGDYSAQHISYITISDNEITNNAGSGVSTYGTGHNTIIDNIVAGNAGNGISIKYDNGDIVSGNTITGNTAMGINMHQVTNTIVENNIVTGHVSEAVVTTFWGNTITAGKGSSAIYIHEASHDNIIRLNTLTGNKIGVLISRESAGVDPSNNSINNNKITSNTVYGIQNALVNPSTSVNATLNWWGTANKDAITTLVGANVLYDPWLYCDAFTQCADLERPVITFIGEPYFSETTTFTIEANITDDRGITSYEIDFDDGETFGETGLSSHTTFKGISKEHIFPNGVEATYTITITACDEVGCLEESTTLNIDTRTYDWIIPLKTGWNLISFPMIPTDENHVISQTVENAILNRIYDSLPSSGYVVYKYNATGNWEKTKRDGYGGLDYIYPGYAYWIKVEQDTVLKGYGTLDISGPEQVVPSVSLGKSWNLIGKFGDKTITKSQSTNNLVFDSEIKGLKDFPLMHDGTFVAIGDNLVKYEGYWTLLPGNNGNPISYTLSEADITTGI